MNPNPYVGPRPFDRDDQDLFFGRAAEVEALVQAIATHREVLVYSPAGAGKTSLLNAGVIPALAARKLVALPPARVSLPALHPLGDANPFVYSALLSLHGPRADAQSLAGRSLTDGLQPLLEAAPLLAAVPLLAATPAAADKPHARQRATPRGAGRSAARGPAQVVIFDQFEELLWGRPERAAQALDFFEQLAAALAAYPRLVVVFALREEWLAALEPYLALLPGSQRPQTRAHFRLEALSAAAALEAVTGPARLAQVEFAPGQAESLVDGLRRASTPDDPPDPPEPVAATLDLPTDAAETTPAAEESATLEAALEEPPAVSPPPPIPEVEPLLLQVTCCRLWANLPDGARAISQQDIARSARPATLEQALRDYYQTAVRDAAAVGAISDNEVRRWFSQALITPQGERALLTQDLLETGGLSNLAVLELEDLHLVVSHVWAGQHWYELAQECFIEPVRADNAAWEQSLDTPLRITARNWQRTGEPGLLYRGKALKAARAWAETAALTGPGEVEPAEWEFIAASEKGERAINAVHGWALAAGVALLLFAAILGLLAHSSQQRAIVARQAQLNLQKERATAVMNAQQLSQQRASALLAAEAAQRARDEALRQAQSSTAREYAALSSQALDNDLPQTSLLLALQSIRQSQQAGELRSVTGEQALRDALGQVSGAPLQGHTLGVNNLAASPDRRWLATVSDDGSLRLWDLTAPDPGAGAITLNPGQGWLGAVAFSADGRWLAAAGADAVVHVWDMAPVKDPPLDQALQKLEGQSAVLLKGHTSTIEGLRFTPDGRWLVSASADKTVRAWPVDRLPAIPDPLVLSGPTEALIVLEVSPDSRWVAAGGRSGAVWAWDLTALNPASNPRQMALQDRVNSLTFSPDSRYLAAGGLDRNVVLWDMRLANPGAQPLGLGQHDGAVQSLDFSPDGCWLASGGADNKILLWYIGVPGAGGLPGQTYYALSGHTGAVDSLDFPKMIGPRANYQATRLVSGSADHTVRVWDLSPLVVNGSDCRRPAGTGGQAAQAMPGVRRVEISATTLHGLDGAALKVDILPGNRWLAATGADGSARLWDLRALSSSVEPLQFTPAGAGRLYAGAVSQDGKWLAAAGQAGVFAWSLQNPLSAPGSLGCAKNGAYSLAAGPKGLMAAGCLDGSLLLWNTVQLPAGPAFQPLSLANLSGVVYAIAFSTDGQWLAAGDETGKLVAWKLVNGIPQGDPLTLMADGGTLYSLLFDSQGRWLASADAKGRVHLWNLASTTPATPLATFQVTSAPVYSLAESPDGRWLAAGTWDRAGVVRLWDLSGLATGGSNAGGAGNAGEPPAFTLGGFINRVYALAFSPDGHWLAAGSADFTLRQWDLTRLAALDPAKVPQPNPRDYATLLDDHKDLVFQAVYSPNSRWLLSASVDTTVRQWDTQDPQALPVVFNGHTAWVRMLAVTPDGRYVISVAEDGSVRRWALSLDDLQRAACQETRRGLTALEVNRYLHGAAPEVTCAPSAATP